MEKVQLHAARRSGSLKYLYTYVGKMMHPNGSTYEVIMTAADAQLNNCLFLGRFC